MAGPAGGRELPDTPTWAVAVVCAVMILVSVAMEHALHKLGHHVSTGNKNSCQTHLCTYSCCAGAGVRVQWFHKRRKKALGEALEKMKAELMLVGFISLLLTVAQDPVSRICISKEAGEKMLPCKPYDGAGGGKGKDNHRRLLWLQGESETHRRFLAAPAGVDVCAKQGKVALMPAGSMHQLHIFIFVLAVFHVLYSVVTMTLSRLKMKQWKKWESETASLEYQFANGQLEDDFKVVVGISLKLWFVAVLILFLDYDGIGTLLWMSVVPLVILLWVGTKLEMVIMEMAQEIHDRESVVKGAPAVEPSNKYFWFNRPDWVLFLMHLTLFQNAFQMAHFVWTVATPGLKKCYHEKMAMSIAKVVLGVAAQILCSYITFPLYALVTQMGSHMKRSIFDEQTAKALTNWRKMAKEKKKARDAAMLMAQMGGGATPSVGSSPVHLLHKAGARSDDPQSVPASPRAEKEGGGVQHPARKVPPCDGWRSASSPALDAHIPGADFGFSTQR